MIDARFRPLDRWIGEKTPTNRRKRATFRAKYQGTLDLLEHELQKLSARDIVIEAEFATSEIRNDGWPRGRATPKGPAVILSFTKRSGSQQIPVAMPCDTFDDWEDNLRGIALSLEALRAVDRYGVTRSGEQYAGFAQISAPAASDNMTVDIASHVLASFVDGAESMHSRLVNAEV